MLLDSLLGRYKIILRSKKWYIRLLFHLLDLSVINAWLIYVKVKRQRNEKFLQLSKFRLELAECLCKYGQLTTPTRGHPVQQNYRKKKISKKVPPKDVRFDNVGHLPNFTEKRQRCKMENWKGFSNIECEKC